MAYRAHITVIDPAVHKRVGLTALKRLFPNGVRNTATGGMIGHVGTRSGAPGIWIERNTAGAFGDALRHVAASLANVGCDFRIYATNKPSAVIASAYAEYAGRA